MVMMRLGLTLSRSAVGPVRARKTSSRSGWCTSRVLDRRRRDRRAGRAARAAAATSPRGGICSVRASSSRARAGERAWRPRPGRRASVERAADGDRRGRRRLSSAGVPSATIRPPSSTAIRSASWSASSRYWVVSRMVTPSATSARTTSHIAAAAAGVEARWSARRGRSPAGRRSGSWPGRACASCRRSRSTAGLPAASCRSNRSSSSAARPRPSARPRWCRSAIRRRFSSPVSRPSTAENWPVTPIAARTASGSRGDVVAGDPRGPGVGAEQGGQDVHGGGLAGAVRPEQREDGAGGDRQVDAVEHDVVAERLAQAGARWPMGLWVMQASFGRFWAGGRGPTSGVGQSAAGRGRQRLRVRQMSRSSITG